MSHRRVLLSAALALAVSWLAGCASGVSPESIQAREPVRVHSAASPAALVACLKGRLGDDANVVSYPEPGRVDIRIGSTDNSEYRYYHLVSLRRGGEGTEVEIRSADEWHPLLSGGRVRGMVEDCAPAKTR
ncbi:MULTISPECIES: hypothetical protein [Cupriavidus]|uniref:hypothetical protein n=1 Tax=Cupriavidus sp. WS TaxID=1312922 RepID=UPI0003A88151|nr:hypothetical protein [Cupriavidus sp. WS]